MDPDHDFPQYTVAHLRRAFAEDPRTSELGVRVTIRGSQVYLSGEVPSAQRKEDLEVVVREMLPSASIRNDVHVVEHHEPGTEREELR